MQLHTRIAPSPTGDMHIGTARTAYFNWLAARASGGRFILRIDDTDLSRSKPEYTDVIVETMHWLKLDYDALIKQSDRFDLYRRTAADLMGRGCARQQDGAVVLHLPADHKPPTEWRDEVVGTVRITPDNVQTTEGMVLIKSDGTPSYNFATVVDDIETGINYIIRGTDHITNTARQVILFDLLDGGRRPAFAHIGLIGVGGKVLSKRDGAASMLSYRDRGYHPEAVLNFMARLGWGPKVDDRSTALLPKERMLELFLSGGRMRASLANMDLAKLDSFDRKYKAIR
jgi:nondiscriminating glutamyl-tRNA synthetase